MSSIMKFNNSNPKFKSRPKAEIIKAERMDLKILKFVRV